MKVKKDYYKIIIIIITIIIITVTGSTIYPNLF